MNRCPKCGNGYSSGQTVCLRCGETLPRTDPDPIRGGTGPVVREYRGKLAEANRAFQNDAAQMARSGYFPASQTYQPGTWSAAAFLVALLLCLVLVGILVFIYMLIVKPAGSLVVTYEYRG